MSSSFACILTSRKIASVPRAYVHRRDRPGNWTLKRACVKDATVLSRDLVRDRVHALFVEVQNICVLFSRPFPVLIAVLHPPLPPTHVLCT